MLLTSVTLFSISSIFNTLRPQKPARDPGHSQPLRGPGGSCPISLISQHTATDAVSPSAGSKSHLRPPPPHRPHPPPPQVRARHNPCQLSGLFSPGCLWPHLQLLWDDLCSDSPLIRSLSPLPPPADLGMYLRYKHRASPRHRVGQGSTIQHRSHVTQAASPHLEGGQYELS